MMKLLIHLMTVLLPWGLRRAILCKVFGYQIDATARIGLAMVYPQKLIMGPRSRIGHGTVCRGITLLQLGEYASIGTGNWIGGHPENGGGGYFEGEAERRSALILEEHAAVTTRHIIDCTNRIRLGKFSTLAGFNSQLLTHSIDIFEGRQTSGPIDIGAYCFVGTGVVILKDSALPDYSVLGARALLQSRHVETHTLYAGVPAKAVKALPTDAAYFTRVKGVVK